MTTHSPISELAILVVDDETQSLKYFEKSFGKEFRVLTAPGVDEALELVAEHGESIGLVMTDQRMPSKTGVDLLNQLRRDHPRIIRILTTAYSDLDSAIDAVNSGAIYKYVVKPWNLKDLRGTIVRALEFAALQRERDQLLREKIGVLQRLMIADRVRNFTFLAAGLGNRIRNSMCALKEFIDQAPLQVRNLEPELLEQQADFWGDIWQLARDETEQILTLIQRVSDTVAKPSYEFSNEVVIGHLVESVLTQPPALRVTGDQITIDTDQELPRLHADEQLLGSTVRRLAETAADLAGPNARLAVAVRSVEHRERPHVRIHIAVEGAAWTDTQVAEMFNPFPGQPDDRLDRQLDLLSAFFVAHHHAGQLNVHQAAPDGPGFEILLPVADQPQAQPETHEILDRVLLRYESLLT
ncbi:MAG: response regulator [Planctomycetota bacterium]